MRNWALTRTIGRLAAGVALLMALAAPGTAGPLLTAISGDDFGVPRRVQTMDVGLAATSALGDLGDGSLGFTGGLAYNGSQFLLIGSDSDGNSSLYGFTTVASLTALLPLGQGFSGGLAHTGSALYAVSNDMFGSSTLNQIDLGGLLVTPLFALGSGFTGGLTYNANDGLLYGVASDAFGASTLFSINLVSQQATAQAIALGQGFTGGLAYDPSSMLFYALASDMFAQSTLYSFSLNDVSPTALFGPGPGFLAAGLVVGAATGGAGGGGDGGDAAVPEPATVLLVAFGLMAGGGARWRRARHRAR
jgi:hypothetical protein